MDQNPIHRRIIVPWYDSEVVCLAIVFVLLLTLLFSFLGITVARETPAFQRHLWFPLALVLLSASGIVSLTLRLIKRYLQRF